MFNVVPLYPLPYLYIFRRLASHTLNGGNEHLRTTRNSQS